MPAFRRHRLRIRLSLFAMLALLWSQLAFAAHAPCMDDEHAHAVIEVVTTDCGHEMPPPQEPVCAVHCSQGEMTADAVRTLSVPPLPFLPLPYTLGGIFLPADAGTLSNTLVEPPPLAWHRPTPHPAALLLI